MILSRKALSIAVAAALGWTTAAPAQTIEGPEVLAPMIQLYRELWSKTPDASVRMTIPLHGGILEFSMPRGYVPAIRATGDGAFMMTFVPDGDEWPNWSSAVIVQSSARLGGAPPATPELAEMIYKPRSCASDPLWESLGEKDLGSPEPAFLASTGCRSLGESPEQGQQTFLAFLRGNPQANSVAFAQRGAAFTAPPVDAAGARAALDRFGTILFCKSAEQPGCRDVWAREQIRKSQ